MIRGKVIALLLLALLSGVLCNKFENIELSNVERTVNLAGPYATEVVKLTLHANEDHISHLSYLIPLDYDAKIARIFFVKSGKDKNSLPFARSVYIYNGGSFAHYRVKLPFNLNIDQEVDVTAQIVYLNRYANLPQSISLNEDQKLQYEDSKFIVSPYSAEAQKSTYKYAKILEFDQDGEKKGMVEVTFTARNSAPFAYKKHSVLGVNNNPQVKFAEVEKVVDVSHWGNVAITENYKIVNTGPSLKGEFSRVAYGSRSQADAKNAYKGMDFDLPYEIWGLYYRDEVGNITTSNAYRDESSQSIHVSLRPRFSLLGGWKSNWEMGYNFKTDGLLFHSGNNFQLKNIKLQYAMEKVIAENFRIKVVLPHGVENVRIKIGGSDYDMSLVEVTDSEGYLDFNGKPTFTIDNFVGSPREKYLEVYYDFPQSSIYEKPIKLFLTIASILFFAIFAKRFRLEAFEQKSE